MTTLVFFSVFLRFLLLRSLDLSRSHLLYRLYRSFLDDSIVTPSSTKLSLVDPVFLTILLQCFLCLTVTSLLVPRSIRTYSTASSVVLCKMFFSFRCLFLSFGRSPTFTDAFCYLEQLVLLSCALVVCYLCYHQCNVNYFRPVAFWIALLFLWLHGMCSMIILPVLLCLLGWSSIHSCTCNVCLQ